MKFFVRYGVYGATSDHIWGDVVLHMTIAGAKKDLERLWGLPKDAVAFVDHADPADRGVRSQPNNYTIRDGDTIEFVRQINAPTPDLTDEETQRLFQGLKSLREHLALDDQQSIP